MRATMNFRSLSIISIAILFSLKCASAIDACSYVGGWSLRVNSNSCPPDAPVQCGVGAQPRCCPSGFTCAGDGTYEGNYCCQGGQDCTKQALDTPKCPTSQWTLFGVNGTVNDGGWCCLPGFDGVYSASSGVVACVPAGTQTLAVNVTFAPTVSTSSCIASSTITSAVSSTTSAALTTSATISATTAAMAKKNTGMHPGEIAGIVIGAIASMGLLMLALAVLCWRRKNRRNQRKDFMVPPGDYQTQEMGASMPTHNVHGEGYKTWAREMPNSQRHEIADGGQHIFHELGSSK